VPAVTGLFRVALVHVHKTDARPETAYDGNRQKSQILTGAIIGSRIRSDYEAEEETF